MNTYKVSNAADTEAASAPRASKPRMSALAILINYFFNLMLLGLAAYIISRVIIDLQVTLFTLHVIFLVVGYLILMANAIMIMSDNHFLAITSTQKERVLSHWLLQMLALAFIIAGHSVIFVLKYQNNLPRFQSVHSLVGLAAFILTLISGVQGVFTRYSFQLRKVVKPLVQKIFHSLVGNVSYMLGVVSICFGIDLIWKRDYDIVVNPIIVTLLSVSCFYVLIKSLFQLAGRVKQLFK